MDEGIILKALSGFYYVETDNEVIECRARGKFRLEGISPLVGDRVAIDLLGGSKGQIVSILPRKNFFVRPAAANLELMVIIASGAIPVTDPYLIDRIIVIAETNDCEPIICINKTDLESADELYETYSLSGFSAVRTSAVTGEGVDELMNLLAGKVCVFTGNSGVGKSSILNSIDPELGIRTAEVSQKLGRGRHTTRHVELFKLKNGAIVADTPGFAAFEAGSGIEMTEDKLQYAFRDFAPYLGKCRFNDCAHIKEIGCEVLSALEDGKICPSRHRSYIRLYNEIREINRNKYN